jgi:hypothetical protein
VALTCCEPAPHGFHLVPLVDTRRAETSWLRDHVWIQHRVLGGVIEHPPTVIIDEAFRSVVRINCRNTSQAIDFS